VLRSLAGFGFPLFAPYMYAKLHYGWGNSLLALWRLDLGWPAPILLWKFGERVEEEEYVCCWVDGVSVGKGREGEGSILLDYCACALRWGFCGLFVRGCIPES
jgi:hypothetical protein